MTLHVAAMTDTEAPATEEESGLGALRTERGNLPLESVDATVRLTGLVGRTVLTQGFHNPHDVPLEATYVFPLPDRAAVTAMRMTADERVIEAQLQERQAARDAYDKAVAEGRRAAIAEEERPDVFTIRVGNILPAERVSVELTLVGPLSYEDGWATYRLPLVVAPRYIPGSPIDAPGVGAGYAQDTDAVPDASRITPPVLLPGFPNPVRLSIGVDIDAAGLPLGEVRSSLHTVVREDDHLRVEPGERANRDFILRLAYGEADTAASSLALIPDAEGSDGTFRLTILPPTTAAPPRPRDVVLVLDRSGSMQGWKMVCARRAAARIIDTLTATDRFAALAFDDTIEYPTTLGNGLVAATDRNRFRAVEHLSRVDARGGTEMLAPLRQALGLLTDTGRDRVLVLVTDGQVGNEDQILAKTASALAGVRVHTVGIDQAVNAGFLGRLATAGGGRCELVESEDRLDGAMDQIHRRIGAPVVSALSLAYEALTPIDGTVTPARLPDLFPGAPLVVSGRYRKADGERVVSVRGKTRRGEAWAVRVHGGPTQDSSATAVWARAHLRDLEDRYLGQGWGEDSDLERRIVATSLRFGVLCRFTAWVAVDTRVVTDGGEPHRIIQPVEPAAGWDMLRAQPMRFMAAVMPAAPPMAARAGMMAGRGRRMVLAESAPEHAGADALAAARALAEMELHRLRSTGSTMEDFERREFLADLGTRLPVLVQELATAGADASTLRELAQALTEERLASLSGAALEELWQRVVAALTEAATPSGKPTRPFWKKG